jgi:lysophospholipase L1-like esterase
LTIDNSQLTIVNSPTPILEPTSTVAPISISEATQSPIPPTTTPEPTRPIAGFGYLEWLEDNGEAAWTHLTAYGPRINSVAHASMYDVDGNIVYDNIIEYNGKGYRGPEATYEKPEDVYRILIMGDSFVEALQVPYEQTFQAQLQAQLSQHDTPERRHEVVAMGRTGWGTMHEATYYQVEGYKYNADLVILMFYINDVADNLPRVFYPNINNTNYDFVINEGQVQILDTNQQVLPPNNGRLLYNALHWRLRETNLAKLFIRLADPPIPIVTPGGVMTRVHPQFYIYVTEPEVEGYSEAWQRTADLLHLLTTDVQNDGAQFAVVPIFLGSEMVNNVSNWFPDLTEGWQWDDGLPEQRLAEILADTPAQLWPVRPTFEAYADSVDGEVYNLLYLPEDGHFNALGHQLTYEAIYNWLVDTDVVP